LPDGVPTVPNGLSLCKLHHAAYDAQIVGISPDYVVQVREDIRREKDGPVLEHGLKGMHGGRLFLPRGEKLWPDREKLEIRFERFRLAG
jgi:putative restriction endonuclease